MSPMLHEPALQWMKRYREQFNCSQAEARAAYDRHTNDPGEQNTARKRYQLFRHLPPPPEKKRKARGANTQ